MVREWAKTYIVITNMAQTYAEYEMVILVMVSNTARAQHGQNRNMDRRFHNDAQMHAHSHAFTCHMPSPCHFPFWMGLKGGT